MISKNKILLEKQEIVTNCKQCRGLGCGICAGYCRYIDKMVDAEIPLDYWFREMVNFYGEENFKNFIIQYTNNIENEYKDGLTLGFVGPRGTGKTMAACAILKAALLKGYSAYYITLVDVVNKLIAPGSAGIREGIKELDYLVIDEVDQRFFPSPNSRDLYGNQFENLLRTRVQNKLPTIFCTNSEDVSQIFGGEFEISFASLRAQFVKILHAGGKDARKSKEKL